VKPKVSLASGMQNPLRNIHPQPPHPMNKLSLKGDWNITKGKLKQKYATLTDDDLNYVEGKEDELLGRLQKRTGETRENIERYLHEESKR
jgi:uncharacterized protein YjbJ (UPF0337 family)